LGCQKSMGRTYGRNQRTRLQRTVVGLLLTLGLATAILPILTPPQPASAQSIGERIRRLFDRSRPQGSASGRASGGAVRDEGCRREDASSSVDVPSSFGLRALVRDDNHGTTNSLHPVFYFFTSYTSDLGNGEGGVAELMMIDDSQYQLFDQPLRVQLPENPGIVRVEVPDSMPPLQPRRSYQWSLMVVCNEQEPSKNPFVSGWIERVNPNVEDEAPNWHEAVDELARTRRDRTDEWLTFLEIYGLEALVEAPVVELPVVNDVEEEGLPDFLTQPSN